MLGSEEREPDWRRGQRWLVARGRLGPRLGLAEGHGASAKRVFSPGVPGRSAGGEVKGLGRGPGFAKSTGLWKAVGLASWRAPGSVNLELVHS